MEVAIDKLALSAVGAALLLLLVVLEIQFPQRHYDRSLKGRAYLANLLLFAFNNSIFLAFNISAVYTMVYGYRLLTFFDALPLWGQALLGILLLDFCIWIWHWTNHKVNLLWRFHKVHHSEQYLNATSALRFHIGELLLSVAVKSVVLVVFGVSFWIFILYEMLVTFFAAFHHANIHIPPRIQRALEKVIITPDMHRTHHSSLRDEHDSNYGVIFSWWDRILHTFDRRQPKHIGLAHTPEKNFWSMLTFPFQNK